MNLARRRPRRGVSLVEFLVASSLILVVLVGAGSTLASSERSLARSMARDAAAVTAANILEQAALFGCQTQSDPTEALRLAETCASLRTLATSGSGSGLSSSLAGAGDYVFDVNVPSGCEVNTPGCTKLTVSLTSRWLRAGQDEDVCAAPGDAPPALLERRIRIAWRTSTQSEPVVAEYVTASARPASSVFSDQSRRWVRVEAPAGTPVVVLDANDNKLVRFAAACSGTSSGGEAWFAFLPADREYRFAALPGFDPESADAAAVFGAAVIAAETGVEVDLSECRPEDSSGECPGTLTLLGGL